MLLVLVYLLIGPCAWALAIWLLLNGRRHMRLMRRPVPELKPGKTLPRVTILIPAKDEGQRIAACIQSALDQDYPDFHVIAIDDRSEDDTGRVMDRLAEQNRNLSVVHILPGELPNGWTGKCNALHRGVQSATGEYLLFIDSDVIIDPDALSATVRRCQSHQVDLLSLLPRLETHNLWEAMLIPLAGAAVTGMFAVSLTNSDHLPNSAFANGQFLFFKRSAYEQIGGHARVKGQYCEDIEFARFMKPRGFKVRISWGAQFAAVRMYSSLSAIFRGWARIFFAGSRGTSWRMCLAIFLLIICAYSAYAAAGYAIYLLLHGNMHGWKWVWVGAASVHLLLMHGLVAAVYRWTGNARRNTLLFPISGLLLIWIWLRSIRLCRTKRIEWRGTVYRNLMEANEPRIHL